MWQIKSFKTVKKVLPGLVDIFQLLDQKGKRTLKFKFSARLAFDLARTAS